VLVSGGGFLQVESVLLSLSLEVWEERGVLILRQLTRGCRCSLVKSNVTLLSLLKALSTLQQRYVPFTTQGVVYVTTMALWTLVKSNGLFFAPLKVSSS
jgi:hypothetical protein